MSDNSAHVINHCGMRDALREAGVSQFDFRELVMKRAGEIIASVTSGAGSEPHEFAGIELTAFAVAMHVIDQGASQIADDLGTDLDELKQLAASEHISSC